jgi:type I restriction enzyme R subunit
MILEEPLPAGSLRQTMSAANDDALAGGLPQKDHKDTYRRKCDAIFEHVYESYPEKDTGVYSAAV